MSVRAFFRSVAVLVIVPLLATTTGVSVAAAGIPSNQVVMNAPLLCTTLEGTALMTYNTKITVSGHNQDNNEVTWTTTSHVDGAFETTNWWWQGTVVVTLHPVGHAAVSFSGLVPAAKSSSTVEIYDGNSVIMSCKGTQSPMTTVDVPHWGSGGNWVACVGLDNPTGTYYVQRAYSGYFYYNGGTYIAGSTGGYSYTPGSFQVVTNSLGQKYDVPLHPVSAINQRVCYS